MLLFDSEHNSINLSKIFIKYFNHFYIPLLQLITHIASMRFILWGVYTLSEKLFFALAFLESELPAKIFAPFALLLHTFRHRHSYPHRIRSGKATARNRFTGQKTHLLRTLSAFGQYRQKRWRTSRYFWRFCFYANFSKPSWQKSEAGVCTQQ